MLPSKLKNPEGKEDEERKRFIIVLLTKSIEHRFASPTSIIEASRLCYTSKFRSRVGLNMCWRFLVA